MKKQKYNFIRSLFQFLSTDSYVLLKWLKEDLLQLPDNSDLDILIPPSLEEKIATYIHTIPAIDKIRKEKRAGVHHYFLYFKDGDFLQIDLLFQLLRKNLVYLPVAEVFDKCIEYKGIKTCTPSIVFEHVFLFNYLNYSGLPKKYFDFFQLSAPSVQNWLLKELNNKYGTSFSNLEEMTHFKEKNRQAIVRYLKKLSENNLLSQIKNQWYYLTSTLSNLKSSKGKVITFSGVDGAGKSTIIEDTQHLLGNKYRKKVVLLRHRPSIFPIISAWKYGKTKAAQISVSHLPRQGKNNSKISSFLRFGYYYLDYLIGQVYVWARYEIWGYIVLYDRFYFDFIIDGKRSNISMSEELPRKLYPFIKKPDLNFFLYADAKTILQRKQELSTPVIESLTKGYRTLFQDFSKNQKGVYLDIENIDREKTLYTIVDQYLKIV